MLNARRSPVVAGAYLVGAIAGACASAAALFVGSGLLSPVPVEARAAALAAIIAVLLGRALGMYKLKLPQNSRQIPREAFMASPGPAAFGFAFELGTSVRTYITKEAPYVAAASLLLLAPSGFGRAVMAAALLGCGFGVGRSTIVSTQVWRQAFIAEHPPAALRIANLISFAAATLLVVRAF